MVNGQFGQAAFKTRVENGEELVSGVQVKSLQFTWRLDGGMEIGLIVNDQCLGNVITAEEVALMQMFFRGKDQKAKDIIEEFSKTPFFGAVLRDPASENDKSN